MATLDEVDIFVCYRENEERLESSIKATYAGQAAGQWLELRYVFQICTLDMYSRFVLQICIVVYSLQWR